MHVADQILDPIDTLAPGAFAGASPETTTAKGAVNVCIYWSGREDSNLRPLPPEDSALPG